VTRENTQLHQRLVIQTEESMKTRNTELISFFSIQTENRKLQLQNQQASKYCKSLIQTIDQLKNRLQHALSRPSKMKFPEILVCDVAHHPKQLSNRESIPTIPFDLSLIETEFENLRNEKSNAEKRCEEFLGRISLLEKHVTELDGFCAHPRRDLNQEADVRLLKHQLEKQNQELEKLTVQLKATSGSASPRKQQISEKPAAVGQKVTEISKLNEIIVGMVMDFAFIYDHIADVLTEKKCDSPKKCERCRNLERKLIEIQQQQQLKKTELMEIDARENAFKDYQKQLMEAERKVRVLGEKRQRDKEMFRQFQKEQDEMRITLNNRLSANHSLSERLADANKRIQELEFHQQLTREEITASLTRTEDMSQSIVDDDSTIMRLEHEVRAKTKESEVFEKMLTESQRQLTKLNQTIIPGLKANIARLEKDKNEAIQKIRHLSQLGVRLESSIEGTGETRDLTVFFSELRQIENEYVKRGNLSRGRK
jgi:chromosome segregation ATPase